MNVVLLITSEYFSITDSWVLMRPSQLDYNVVTVGKSCSFAAFSPHCPTNPMSQTAFDLFLDKGHPVEPWVF